MADKKHNVSQLISQNLRGEITIPDKRQAFEHSENSVSVRHRLSDLLWAIRDNDIIGVRNSIDDETINAYTPEGTTSLILASQLGHAHIVELLLENGAILFARTSDSGLSALHFAQERGHHQVVDILMRSGAHLSGTSDTRAIHAL